MVSDRMITQVGICGLVHRFSSARHLKRRLIRHVIPEILARFEDPDIHATETLSQRVREEMISSTIEF